MTGGAEIMDLNDSSSGIRPLTLSAPRRESAGPYLSAVMQLTPAFFPPDTTLVDAYELPDLRAATATYTAGNYTAYSLSVQRHDTQPDLGEILLNAVRVDLPSGSTRYDVTGLDYAQVILTRPSGIAINVTVPSVPDQHGQSEALSALAAHVTDLLDLSSSDVIGLVESD